MSDDAMIRRANLKRLMKARGWNYATLAELTGKGYSYWPELLKNEKKSFGEKVARSIEQALELPRLWLDDAAEIPPLPEAGAMLKQVHRVTGWPFEKIDEAKVQSLSRDDLMRLEGMLITLASSIGLDVANELAA
ncbi:MAG: hypothetical protein HEQ39_09575 [Rhizobacter sp.]